MHGRAAQEIAQEVVAQILALADRQAQLSTKPMRRRIGFVDDGFNGVGRRVRSASLCASVWPAHTQALKRRNALPIRFDPEMSWMRAGSQAWPQQTSRDTALLACCRFRGRRVRYHGACLELNGAEVAQFEWRRFGL